MFTPAAAVFDLYGTLLDVASLRDVAAGVTADPAPFVAAWRDKQIAYTFASALMGVHEDFDAITGHALRYTAARFGVALDPLRQKRLLDAWSALAPYPDVAPALRALRERGVPAVVLTNGTPETAASALANGGLVGLVERVFSIEAAGVYKPDPRVYALVTAHFGAPPERFAFVTSNGWDATGAAAFGMRVAWCNRAGVPAETFGPKPAWVLASLAELIPALEGSP